MKLIIVIVGDEDSHKLMVELNHSGYSVTKMSSTGGFLRSGNTTLMIGVNKEELDNVITIIKEKCKSRKQVISSPIPLAGMAGAYSPYPVEINLGGAIIFVVDVERFEKV